MALMQQTKKASNRGVGHERATESEQRSCSLEPQLEIELLLLDSSDSGRGDGRLRAPGPVELVVVYRRQPAVAVVEVVVGAAALQRQLMRRAPPPRPQGGRDGGPVRLSGRVARDHLPTTTVRGTGGHQRRGGGGCIEAVVGGGRVWVRVPAAGDVLLLMGFLMTTQRLRLDERLAAEEAREQPDATAVAAAFAVADRVGGHHLSPTRQLLHYMST
jgi:hypothetical protein